MTSSGPREARLRQTRLSLVADAEGVDPGALRLSHHQVRPDRVEHAGEPHRLAGLDTEGDDVLDLEVDHVVHPDAVQQAVVLDVDRRALHAEHLPDQWCEPGHRPTQLTTEDLDQLVELLLRCVLVDEHADTPVTVRHHLRSVGDEHDLPPGDVDSVHRTLMKAEGKGHPAEVVGRPMVKGHVAGAHELTRAGLAVTAGQAPRHQTPTVVSAMALSRASPTDPTEGSMPSSTSRLVSATD